ncbi:CAP domain-containing protein [Streptomyces sp. NPDC005931]|uniref:CAP domain-containing protein n=1 Tax=Streptomyces sp. NPDC005931 TaxID=3364737 RepID=UPI00367B65BF
MSELVPGGNLPLPGGTVTVRVPGPFDVSALITDDSGTVRDDGDFVFYNQPSAPGTRLDGATLVVDAGALRPGATRVTVAVSPADPGTPLSGLPSPVLEVTGVGGRPLARFRPPRPGEEAVLLLAEIYRRGEGWKVRALGHGYADGLAGLARDFGVDVVDGEPADTGPAGTASHAPLITRPTTARPRAAAASPAPPAGGAPRRHGAPDAEGVLGAVNSSRAEGGSPPVVLDSRLVSAARAHAATMAAAGRLGVETRDGVSVYQRVVAAGYAYLTIGEHLVSGPRTPAELVAHCLRNEPSRRTLHDPAFLHAGLARAAGGPHGDVHWAAIWARPLSPDGLARTADDVIGLTNRERARAGLPALGADPLLTAAAQAHSADMVARDFYAHTAPDGSRPRDRATAAGSTRRTVGENIACGQRSAAEVVQGWMNSPGHRANILRPEFTHIGVGFAGGGRAGTYWTQLFGG